jgi:phosphopantetheinyl transferase (holo-ACP synthase)
MEMGVDIETERDQLNRIAARFLHPAELAEWPTSASPKDYLQVSWGAKEALYKVYGRKKLIFKENLLLSGLHPAVAETFTGCIKTSELTRFYELSWFKPDPKTWVVFVARQVNQ